MVAIALLVLFGVLSAVLSPWWLLAIVTTLFGKLAAEKPLTWALVGAPIALAITMSPWWLLLIVLALAVGDREG